MEERKETLEDVQILCKVCGHWNWRPEEDEEQDLRVNMNRCRWEDVSS